MLRAAFLIFIRKRRQLLVWVNCDVYLRASRPHSQGGHGGASAPAFMHSTTTCVLEDAWLVIATFVCPLLFCLKSMVVGSTLVGRVSERHVDHSQRGDFVSARAHAQHTVSIHRSASSSTLTRRIVPFLRFGCSVPPAETTCCLAVPARTPQPPLPPLFPPLTPVPPPLVSPFAPPPPDHHLSLPWRGVVLLTCT